MLRPLRWHSLALLLWGRRCLAFLRLRRRSLGRHDLTLMLRGRSLPFLRRIARRGRGDVVVPVRLWRPEILMVLPFGLVLRRLRDLLRRPVLGLTLVLRRLVLLLLLALVIPLLIIRPILLHILWRRNRPARWLHTGGDGLRNLLTFVGICRRVRVCLGIHWPLHPRPRSDWICARGTTRVRSILRICPILLHVLRRRNRPAGRLHTRGDGLRGLLLAFVGLLALVGICRRVGVRLRVAGLGIECPLNSLHRRDRVRARYATGVGRIRRVGPLVLAALCRRELISDHTIRNPMRRSRNNGASGQRSHVLFIPDWRSDRNSTRLGRDLSALLVDEKGPLNGDRDRMSHRAGNNRSR